MELLIDRKLFTADLQMRTEAKITAVNEKLMRLRRIKKSLLDLTDASCASDSEINASPVLKSVISDCVGR